MIYSFKMIVDKDGVFPNSLSLDSRASFLVHIKSKNDIVEAFKLSKKEGLPLIPTGEGTNIAPGPYVKGVVAILETSGIDKHNALIVVSAGEKWDEVVSFAVKNNLSGIENLSGIPGKAGASPVQNIGAYGTEIKDVLERVDIFDTKDGNFKFLTKKDCEFGYRNSLFKKYNGRYIIVNITLSLSKTRPSMPDYKDVKNYFEERSTASPSILEIRSAILKIRSSKLPVPKEIPNCGSFFKNPFISKELAENIKNILPSVPIFEQNGLFKIPAGFLIDSLGFKGKKIGKIEVYKNNALVLTNPSGATFSDLLFAKSEIEQAIFQKFGVRLEPEVNILE